jgi:hypothetical protein
MPELTISPQSGTVNLATDIFARESRLKRILKGQYFEMSKKCFPNVNCKKGKKPMDQLQYYFVTAPR